MGQLLVMLPGYFFQPGSRSIDRLIAEGLKDDEDICQKARKEVGALIQAITYQEFLPALGIRIG